MGAARSKLSRIVSNTVKNETMMHREVSKEKPKQAPRHPSTVQAFKTLIEENPVLKEIDKTKDTVYLKMLHDFKVDSFDPEGRPSTSDLPTKNARKIPVPGRVTSEQILEIFAMRRQDSVEWTSEKISKKYHLDEETVKNMLIHFNSFNVMKTKKPSDPLDKVDLI